jgi:hypothetical protein
MNDPKSGILQKASFVSVPPSMLGNRVFMLEEKVLPNVLKWSMEASL